MRTHSSIFTSLVILLLSLGAVGCGFRGQTQPLDDLLDINQQSAPYNVRPGDALSVQVWGEPRLSGDVFVRDDGRFSMPLIGDVPAEGKTLDELSTIVTTKLSEFVAAASVSISVAQSAPIRYYLSGSFAKPGEYRSAGSINMLQGIATGGGFAPFADESSIILIRKAQQGEIRYELDFNRVREGKQPNPALKDGDIITVK